VSGTKRAELLKLRAALETHNTGRDQEKKGTNDRSGPKDTVHPQMAVRDEKMAPTANYDVLHAGE